MVSELKPLLTAVVGPESAENLRLADILRRILNKHRVYRYLELSHLQDFVSNKSDHPIVVFFDLFGFDLSEATDTVGSIRDSYPTAVFNLYIDKDVYQERRQQLPGEWLVRFEHYYKTFKENEDAEFEPIVRNSLRLSQFEAEGNVRDGPLRITPSFSKGIVTPPKENREKSAPQEFIFISYCRNDWPNFVSQLVERIRAEGFTVWIDQDLLIGGDDWMDAIGEALDKCKVLVLVVTPEALASKYVKMEYRYFFNHSKRIVPILVKGVERIPPELSTTQYIDFTGTPEPSSYQHLTKVLTKFLASADAATKS